MNVIESLKRSFRHGKPAFFECGDLKTVISFALALKGLSAPVVGEFNGTVGVMAIPKSEVM